MFPLGREPSSLRRSKNGNDYGIRLVRARRYESRGYADGLRPRVQQHFPAA
jgi:hypothetical protein